MKRQNFAVLAVGFAILATLLTATVASAHAPIKFIRWDTQTNPSRLIAATDNREMEAQPGSFYLRVYNASGQRVDNGDAVMTPDRLEVHVTLQPNLPPGAYRVDWKTTSTDGAVLTDSVALSLPGSVKPVEEPEHDEAEGGAHEEAEEPEMEQEGAGEAIAPPSTGDAGLVGGGSGGLNTAGALGVAGLLMATTGGFTFAYRRLSWYRSPFLRRGGSADLPLLSLT